MDVNLSNFDRIARLLLGTFVISLGYIQNDTGFMIDKSVSWFVGLMPIVSALFGRCPIYRMLGISTCPKP
jgi:Protein of unknown function (DUF2892)